MDCDVLIIGAGHNGLTCACYLAGAGLKVRIVEKHTEVGGAAITEEFHPGFRNSVASYTVSLLNPKVIADLNLRDHGLEILRRPLANFLPLPDGDSLSLGNDREANQREFARFSKADAAALPDYEAMLDTAAGVLRDLVLRTPVNPGGGLRDGWRALGLVRRFRRLSAQQQRDVWGLFTRSAADVLDQWFESDIVKGLFGFDAVVGNFASPRTPGSAYVLLHHVFGEVDGQMGAWGHARGGMGAITQAMAAEAVRLGVEIETGVAVRQILVEGDSVVGLETAEGTRLRARAVASNVNPKLLYQELVPGAALAPEFRRAIDGYRCGSASFRMNVALDGLPQFTCRPGAEVADHHRAGILICPGLEYLDRAYLDARRDGWSAEPVVEMLIPSTLDDSLAPPGKHVASLFCQHFAPQLSDGRNWDDEREAAADHVIDTVDRYAPGFAGQVIARQVFSPLDLERRFGLIGGDIFHGALGLDQLYSARPLLGFADYRGPLSGLYHCGSGAHPGGGVTGAPGYNAASEILKDLG